LAAVAERTAVAKRRGFTALVAAVLIKRIIKNLSYPVYTTAHFYETGRAQANELAPETSLEINRGVALQRAGDNRGAVAAYQGALKKDPNWPDAFLNLGFALIVRPARAAPARRRAAVVRSASLAVGDAACPISTG